MKFIFEISIALCDSYETFYKYIAEKDLDYIVIESQSTSWEHDKSIINELNLRFKNLKIVLTDQ